MNPKLQRLHPYPFEKLAALFRGVTPPSGLAPINLSIGEPKHPVPPFLRQAMADALDGIGVYPTTRGERTLRQAAARWAEHRFGLNPDGLDPDRHLLPVNGTREAIFSLPASVLDESRASLVLMPNPFYQIYEGAAFMAGAEPVYVDATPETGLLPDYESLPPDTLRRAALVYLCTPSNPTGATYSLERLQHLIRLADEYDFILASDECYSEIWYDAPPPGLLQACHAMGRHGYDRCVVFHSLSKRSNMPGARSGFVAGDADLLERYFRLRTYTGCATPPFVQHAATLAWGDESHVEENRRRYQEKLRDALAILRPVLPVDAPEAGFYLWLRVPGGGEAFARTLLERYNVIVLPGAYLGRVTQGGNPGEAHVRIAMVTDEADNRTGMERIARCAQEMASQHPIPRT